MNNITNSANVRLLTLGLGLVASFGAMNPAYGFVQYELDRLLTENICQYCDLRDAPLSGLRLQFANVTFSNLTNADFSRTDLFYGKLSTANFTSAKFNNADLTSASFSRSRLESADLTSANLLGATLTYATLTGANFTGANLSYADLTGAIGFVQPTSTLSRAASVSLDSPNFTDAILEGVTAKNALLSNANFTGTSLKGSKFSGTDLQGGDFTGADLTDGIFNKVNFLGANLTNEQLTSAKSLKGSTLPDGTVVAATPEPSSLFGFGAMIALGVGSTLKRKIL